ncbi:MAG: hypothetical protein ACREC4_10590 [Methylocella sp.]
MSTTVACLGGRPGLLLADERGSILALLAGDHAKIKAWREAESLKLTRARRPDLLKRR